MEIQNYIRESLRSEQPLKSVTTDVQLLKEAMSTAIAAADLIDCIKKVVVYGKPLDYKKVQALAQQVADDAVKLRFTASTGAPAQGDTEATVNPRLLHAALGAFGEAGESLAALLHQINGEPLDTDNVIEEAGDKAWYLGLELDEIEDLTGVPPGAVLRKNITKLEVRYPDKFTLEASEARDYGAEAAAMRKVA